MIKDDFGLHPVAAQREVGIEIEIEGKNIRFDKEIGYWNQTHDGSLRGESIEYVLKQPCNREQVAKRLGYLENLLKQNKAKIIPSDRTGVHVHVNCQEDSFNTVMNMICLYLILEHALVRYCGPDREGNMFCLRAEDAEYLVQVLCNAMEDQSFHLATRLPVRYASVNVTSLARYGSLEFRALRTPSKLMDIKTWVDMLLKLKDKASAFNSPEEIIKGLSGKWS